MVSGGNRAGKCRCAAPGRALGRAWEAPRREPVAANLAAKSGVLETLASYESAAVCAGKQACYKCWCWGLAEGARGFACACVLRSCVGPMSVFFGE